MRDEKAHSAKRRLDPEYREKQKARARKRRYGIDESQYQEMLLQQDHRCAICFREFTECQKRGPHVDHNHQTGQVRALLCGECNNGLGKFQEDISVLMRAVEYIRRYAKAGSIVS